MAKLLAAVRDYYESQKWKYDYDADNMRFRMRMGLKSVEYCTVITTVKEKGFTTYCIFPMNVPEEKRTDVALYLHYANYGLKHGNFEMDLNDGEVRYKSCIYCGDIDLEMSCTELLVDMGMIMIDRYAKGILAIMYGNMDPKAACEMVESQ